MEKTDEEYFQGLTGFSYREFAQYMMEQRRILLNEIQKFRNENKIHQIEMDKIHNMLLEHKKSYGIKSRYENDGK